MTPQQVVIEWVAAFNRHDAAAAVALYHDDATNIQVPFGEPVRGRQVMLDSFTAIFLAFPERDTQVEHMFEDGEWASWSGASTVHFAASLPDTPRPNAVSRFVGANSSRSRTARFVFNVGTGTKSHGSDSLDYRSIESHMYDGCGRTMRCP